MTDIYFDRAVREVQQQAIRWLEEGRRELGTVLAMLHDYGRVREAAESAVRESERVRGFVGESERLSAIIETIEGECERLREEVRQLQAEVERHCKERDATAEWLSHVMDEAVAQLRADQT